MHGRWIYALAIAALGAETVLCCRVDSAALGPEYHIVPIIPFPPTIPSLVVVLGIVWMACGLGMLFDRTLRVASLGFGSLFFLVLFVFVVPKAVGGPTSVGLRTAVFEAVALASLAWMLPAGPRAGITARAARWLFATALVVFGWDHFAKLTEIALLLPGWIPWHVFWVAFFGAAFIAAALSIATGVLARWATFCLGAMFLIWVLTLHLPRVLGLYDVIGATHDPAEWSSLFIAMALWGGSWALSAHFAVSSDSLQTRREQPA